MPKKIGRASNRNRNRTPDTIENSIAKRKHRHKIGVPRTSNGPR